MEFRKYKLTILVRSLSANYLKIQEVRRTNYTKLQPTQHGGTSKCSVTAKSSAVTACHVSENTKMSSSPSLPAQFPPTQILPQSNNTLAIRVGI